MHVLDILKERGFFNQCTDEAALRAHLDTPRTFYIGFDPTADSLHVGSLVQLMAMAWLSRAGHHAIAVVGGGTAKVGDPSGRDSTRDILDAERLEHNKRGIATQIAKFCDGTMVDNADWLDGLGYIEVLRTIGRHFSVNDMLRADSVRQRLERQQGLSFIEFNYVLLQSYDFLELYRRHGCTLQVGGGDQWYNIVSGMDLIRRLEGGQSFGLTTPLLTTASGAKMGKTAAGAVWLDPARVTPYDYFQYWINVDDRDVPRFLRLFTFLPIEACAVGDIREAKRLLAREATAVVHGREAAEAADAAATAAFAGGVSADMPTVAVTFPIGVLAALVAAGAAKSNSEARRMVEGNAVSVGDLRVTDPKALIDSPGVLWAGKKKPYRLESA
jgi:tyrosyl-tRNA synthetase